MKGFGRGREVSQEEEKALSQKRPNLLVEENGCLINHYVWVFFKKKFKWVIEIKLH